MSARNKVALITGVTVAKMYAYWITVNYREAYLTLLPPRETLQATVG